MSQLQQLMAVMDRLGDVLVHEDSRLQSWWRSATVEIGEEILNIYQQVFETWNTEDSKVTWRADHFYKAMSTDYVIDISKNGQQPTTVIVKYYVGQLQIWLNGPLISGPDGNALVWYDTFETKDIEGKKELLIRYIKRH